MAFLQALQSTNDALQIDTISAMLHWWPATMESTVDQSLIASAAGSTQHNPG
jgi:hypothetical protein